MTSACNYGTLGSKPRELPSRGMPPAKIIIIIIIRIIIEIKNTKKVLFFFTIRP
jgi:hypothetical protein